MEQQYIFEKAKAYSVLTFGNYYNLDDVDTIHAKYIGKVDCLGRDDLGKITIKFNCFNKENDKTIELTVKKESLKNDEMIYNLLDERIREAVILYKEEKNKNN